MLSILCSKIFAQLCVMHIEVNLTNALSFEEVQAYVDFSILLAMFCPVRGLLKGSKSIYPSTMNWWTTPCRYFELLSPSETGEMDLSIGGMLLIYLFFLSVAFSQLSMEEYFLSFSGSFSFCEGIC